MLFSSSRIVFKLLLNAYANAFGLIYSSFKFQSNLSIKQSGPSPPAKNLWFGSVIYKTMFTNLLSKGNLYNSYFIKNNMSTFGLPTG